MEEKITITSVIKEVFLPLAIYYLVNQVLLMGMIPFAKSYENQGKTETSLVFTMIKMLAMMLAGASVFSYFRREEIKWEKNKSRYNKLKFKAIACVILSGAVLSLVLNYFFTFSGLIDSSQAYQQVAKIQFSVELIPALLFYGVISPCVEELVFRGIIFRTLERSISGVPAIVGSAFIFGAFHGNVVQMLYGTLMGCVMAWIYKKYGRIMMPILFHAAANSTVYLCGYFF